MATRPGPGPGEDHALIPHLRVGFQTLSLSLLGHRMAAGSRLVGLLTAGVCALTLFLGSAVLSLFPKACLGGGRRAHEQRLPSAPTAPPAARDGRSASVVAERPSVIYRLTAASLARMGDETPDLAAAFHKLIARLQAERLDRNNKTMEALLR